MRGVHVAFGILASLSFGCAVTDYRLITDNDQTANGRGSGVVDTRGKALITNKAQVATIWPDGTDELIWFVDQRANGDRTLTTYNNFSTVGEPIFRNDLYCTPDRQGCAITSAPDPETGDVDRFDYTLNPNCSGARSLSVLIATTRYGECGRGEVSLEDRIRWMNDGRVGTRAGLSGLFWDLDATTTTIRLSNLRGFETVLPVTGSATLFGSFEGGRKAILDLSHPGLSGMGRSYADFLSERASDRTEITVVYNGISFQREIAGRIPGRPLTQPARVLEILGRSY